MIRIVWQMALIASLGLVAGTGAPGDEPTPDKPTPDKPNTTPPRRDGEKPATAQPSGRLPAASSGEKEQSPARPSEDRPPPDLKKDLKGLTEDLLDLVVGPRGKAKKDGQPPAAAETGGDKDPLESAIEGMRAAGNRIAGKDTGTETRKVQEEVLRDLEKLLEQARQPPKSPPSSGGSGGSSSSENGGRSQGASGRSPMDSSKSEAPSDSEAASGAEPQPTESKAGTEKSEAEKANESSDEARERREREAEQARRRDLIRDVWGHLPPKVREKLLNVRGDKSLPKYDDLVRRYFEALADDPQGAPGKRTKGPPR